MLFSSVLNKLKYRFNRHGYKFFLQLCETLKRFVFTENNIHDTMYMNTIFIAHYIINEMAYYVSIVI